MYLQAFDFDDPRPHVVHWCSRFRLQGAEPSYHAALSLVPCPDLTDALFSDWVPTPEQVRDAKPVSLPVELLSAVELSSVWHQGRLAGMVPYACRRFRFDPAAHPASLMPADETTNGNYTIPLSDYPLGKFGLDTPLTRIATLGGGQEALFHPIALIKALHGGSSMCWNMLASRVVDHPEIGAFDRSQSKLEGDTLTLALNPELSVRHDWYRAAAWYAFPQALRMATQLFANLQNLGEGKPRGYMWVDVPELPELIIDCRGIPLPSRNGRGQFLVLAIDGMYCKMPFQRVALLGHGPRKVKAILDPDKPRVPRPGRPGRYIKDDMEVLSSGGLKSKKKMTGPRAHKIKVDIGAIRVADPGLPEKEITVPPPATPTPPERADPTVPVGTTGPGISDESGQAETRIAGDLNNPVFDPAGGECHYEDLINVVKSLTTVAGELEAELSYVALPGSAEYKLGNGMVGEFPTDEGRGMLTKFAWLMDEPEVIRRVLIAEVLYQGSYYYVLDCEKKTEKIAIGVLCRKQDGDVLSERELQLIMRASVRTRGVWQALNGDRYQVTKLLHSPQGSVAERIVKAIKAMAQEPQVPGRRSSGTDPSESPAPGSDTQPSGIQENRPPTTPARPPESPR
jgi:hypothetical protein